MDSVELHRHASPVEWNARHISVGDIEALLVDGAMRQLRYRRVEVVRGFDCPIRDRNWATETPAVVEETFYEASDGVIYTRRFTAFNGALLANLAINVQPERVVATLALDAHRRVETNRAGFTLLHPIQGVAGTDLTIQHSNGTEEQSRFPETISPGQPACDIVGLKHVIDGVSVSVRFSGEVFEMEDQRNWTDASYKTYCRPLGLGFPYVIEAGETVEQSIEITLSEVGARRPASVASSHAVAILPEIAIAVEPNWYSDTALKALADLPDARRLLRLDATSENALAGLAELTGPVELELLIDDTRDGAGSLQALAKTLRDHGIEVQSVTALPQAYLHSYQPTAEWPDGHSIADAANWARSAFPNAQIGIGMLTNFTEFNRHPPPAGIGDFTTYSTTAIVHAGDDLSVFETLEALRHVHKSARVISRERPLRLGLATIGMRSNPYGAAVADNPDMARIAMAKEDPRQQTVFGAAFAVGAYAAAAGSGCARIALAGAGGPFATGRIQNGSFRAWPVHHVLRALAGLSGQTGTVMPNLPGGVIGVSGEKAGKVSAVIANCSVAPTRITSPGQRGALMDGKTDVADPDWLDHAEWRALDHVLLPPAAVVFVNEGGAQ
ncbi:hypothetical protein [uncultured Roseobacter sp.]|uniref:hypothetical protein n=1 Tax=uncultured Roseobacter sp. TaxID=114847 RepID=UPI002603B7AB|nr:hypothetical protein [uncultured Roseobacter sp.]